MASVQESVDVDVPIRVAYDQWTQFESFPQFMGGVERITQLDDTHTHWITNIDGVKRSFDAGSPDHHPKNGGPGTTPAAAPSTPGGATSTRAPAARPRGRIKTPGGPPA